MKMQKAMTDTPYRHCTWPIAELQPNLENPRSLSKPRFEDLKRSIRQDPEFLKVRPVIVNVREGRRGIIIGGHMRVEAAKSLGLAEIPVIEVDVDESTERAWMLKDNSHHGEWDRERLLELVALHTQELDQSLPSDVMDGLLAELGVEKQSEEDQADAIAGREPITRPGDVWTLGDHVLLCGDACDPESYSRLLGIEGQADMIFTDPPYNVAVKGRGKDGKSIANDDMDATSWSAFVRKWMANLHANVKGAVYICMSAKEWPSLQQAFVEAGFKWADTIVWVKDRFTVGGADYQHQTEPIMAGRKMRAANAEPMLYGWPDGFDHEWNGGRDEANAWFFRRPGKSPLHPTQKPVELVIKAVSLSSSREATVLDPFAGGGLHGHRVRAAETQSPLHGARPRILRRHHRQVHRPHEKLRPQAERRTVPLGWSGHRPRHGGPGACIRRKKPG